MTRLDIGIASYGNADGLRQTVTSLFTKSVTDWRCLVVVNSHPDPAEQQKVWTVLAELQNHPEGHRILTLDPMTNLGYAGAVNRILTWAESPYVAYCDHDIVLFTHGWDERLADILDRFHEVGIVFPNGGPYPIQRNGYQEILWGVGCCWLMRRPLTEEVGLFDEAIGHHEEVDYQTRIRLAGYRVACCPDVGVGHMARASSDPAASERISAGVRAWVNKWCKYFGGPRLEYHSPNVLRHEDWAPSALYLEEFWLTHFPQLNANPEVIVVNGQEYDLIRVPRLKGFYRHRVI